MKLTLPSLFALALLPAFAQSREVLAIQEVQRQNYTLEHKLDDLKTQQDGKTAQLEALLKQAIDANATLAADLKALQENVRKNQADQQTKVIEPLAGVKVGMEDVSGGVAGLQAALSTMRTRQEKMETTINDLYAAVRIILKQTENVAPPAPVSATPAAPSDGAAILFAGAQSDKLEGKLEFALAAFGEIPSKFPESPLAPKAVYEIGSIYAQVEQYPDALKAFDRVLEQFGENPMRKDAQFRKAEQLASLGRRADAVKEYNVFARLYPGDDKAAEAISRAKALTAPAPAKPKGKR